MLACVDVAYGESTAHAACLVFDSWTDPQESDRVVATAPLPAPYRPGAFFERELPPILAVLGRLAAPLEAVIVDGYVWLGGSKSGLGAHLYAAIHVPVVGVAKTGWGSAASGEGPMRTIPIVRGRSAKPLFVTSAGLDVALAAAHVRSMHGEHRVPTLLKAVDRLARAGIPRIA
jgi:deoxyribonuclease V